MKHINMNKIIAVICAGFIVVSMSGCGKNEEFGNKDYKKSTKEYIVKEPEKVTNSQNNNYTIENNQQNVKSTVSQEQEIVLYFEELEADVDNIINKADFSKFKEKVKNIAITGIDFIFYDTKIKGVTFEELSENAKNKITAIVVRIDNKLESKLPGYKDTIKERFGSGYNYISDKLDEGFNYFDGKLSDKYGEDYQVAKDKTSEIKEEVKDITKDSVDQIKDAANQGFSKIKDWYEEKKNKR